MEWKQEDERLNNCVVWGERSDTDDFFRCADLFLFPSKGDRGNKELNPIVIKEALIYPTLPKLMYNLDVYLNRYHKEEGMNNLSGNLDEDAQKIINLTNPQKENNKEEVLIIGTYPNLKSRVQLTKDTILSMKALGRKIILISHYPVDAEIQKMVDFYLFDAYNPLTHHSYYTRFYRHTNDFHVDIQINGLKHSNQSLTVLINLFTATKFAKDLGFKRLFYSTYDVILDERDIPTIEESFESVVGAADVVKQRFGYQDLNQEKWNSLKRWMSSLGLSRSQLSGSINFDPSEFILSIATTFETNTQFKFGEFAELIGDGMPSLVNPILRNWFRSQNSIINRDSYMDFSECLVWSVEALEHIGRFKIELLDDDSRENIFNLRNRQVSAITFKNPGDNHE